MTASRKLLAWCLLAVVLVIAGVAWSAPTNTVVLMWDWSDTNAQGNVYIGSVSGVYTVTNAVTTNVFATGVPQSTTRYFAVTARNELGLESDFSNELMIQNIKPRAPVLMKYTVQLK